MASPSSVRTATIFGGSGFIGRYVVSDLAQAGWRVVVACRNPDEALFLKTAGSVGQIVPVFCNIRDDASVAAAVRGASAVVNLVGILAEGGRQTFQAVQAEGPARIARAAATAGAGRMVQISAVGASKSSPSRYAQTKAAGEEAVLAAFPTATILRPSIVFGPEDGFFNLFARMAQLSPFLPLIGGGQTRFQPVYVGDVANAVMAALTRDDVQGRTYELGGPGIYSFRQILEMILKETRLKRVLLPLPWGVARLQATVLERLPGRLLTRDQLEQLKSDNVVSTGALTLKDLGIAAPQPVEAVVPSYLKAYRRGGPFAAGRD